ncbi:methyltransferase domain-containing protein [Bacillus cereus group sp. N12]|uniref:class I SAM-dependent methyltransferase n=1 Tax=Bacillus cereus group TaxID=86661 RepID=UPI000BEC6B3A|nr:MULTISPECIES: class I SAM-dependent methyltransferase [Bacillus cereus group]MBJ8078164.1 methyltransferase domain-containing protein [Bacillus cereus group sp. N12]PDY87614.1 methyltransferase type 12 [Bacillus toyonensis]
MKFRESNMPTEELWDSFFDPKHVLDEMGFTKGIEHYIDICCGYGTFLIPASTLISGNAVGIDIDIDYLEICKKNIATHSLKNAHLICGDMRSSKTIEEVQSIVPKAKYVSLFNILHCENPIELLKTAEKLVAEDGKIGVIHWIYADTPRGPALNIRPKSEDIIKWATEVGLSLKKQVELPPYHFGLIFEKQI